MRAQPRLSVCDFTALTKRVTRASDHRDHASVDCGASASAMQGLSVATIDLAAIAHNTELLAKAAGHARLMAVVKANGFGHGAAQVARTALAHGASWLGVTTQAEALQLRDEGIDAPMLMWLYGPREDLTQAVAARIDIS